MNYADDVFRDIEADRAVREREIRLIENAARTTASTSERDMLFRTSILLTYAHLEGFCKFAFSSYISAVNSLKLPCSDACFALVAATLSRVFGALRDSNKKHSVFARALPDDAKLHLAAREQEFIEKFSAVFRTPVDLPESVVNTESNLSSVALKKIMFKLGLDYRTVDGTKSQLDRLLGVRNAIAHGDRVKVPEAKEVEQYTASAFKVMQFVQYEIFNALKHRAYLRQQP